MNDFQPTLSPTHADQIRDLAIEEALERYLMDIFDTGILVLRGTSIVRDNRAARQLLQANDESLTGSSLLDHLPASIHDDVLALLAHSRNQPAQQVHKTISWATGQAGECPFNFTASSIRHGGELLHVLLIRKQDENQRLLQALRERDQRFQQLLDIVPDGIAVHKDGKTVYVNKEALRILGLKDSKSWIGRPALSFVHPDDREISLRRIQELYRTGKPVPFIEERLLRADGKCITVEVAAFPFLEKGEPAVQVVFRDISHRKEMLAALERNEHMFRTLTETTNAIIFIFDENRTHYLNPAARDITGYDIDTLKQLDVEQLIHPDYHARLQQWLHSVLTGDSRLHRIRVKIITREGEERWIDVTGKAVEIGDERLVLGTGFDITYLLKTQHELQQYNQRLEVMRQIDAAGLSTNDLQEIAKVVFQGVPQLMPADRISIFLLDETKGQAQMIAEKGPGTELLATENLFPLEAPTELRAQTTQGEPVYVSHVEKMLHVAPIFQTLYDHGVRSFISAPLHIQGRHMGNLNIASMQPDTYTTTHMQIAHDIADRLAMALQNALLHIQLQDNLMRQQELSRRLVRIQEDERKRIARDVHDELGSHLTALKLSLERLQQVVEGSSHLADWQRACEITENLMKQARSIQQTLRPTMLDEFGLLHTLAWLIERFTKSTDIPVRFSHNGLERRFDPQIEITAYRVVQEALTNAARHALATEVDVMVWAEEDTMEIHITDDGLGMDVEQQLSDSSSGSGLNNIKERLLLINGSLEIYSRPGDGVEVTATIPIAPISTTQETTHA